MPSDELNLPKKELLEPCYIVLYNTCEPGCAFIGPGSGLSGVLWPLLVDIYLPVYL
jgi:hypothetical protein